MKDPFVILRAELVEAAERAAVPAPRKRWGWLRRPSRPVAILLVALVIAGSAAAAVFSLSALTAACGQGAGSDYPCLAGGLQLYDRSDPRAAVWRRRGGGMGVVDRLQQAGHQRLWRGGIRDLALSDGHEPHLRRERPRSAGWSSASRAASTVAYVLTGPQVWAVRIGSRTIRTVSSRALPTGDRAAVFFIPAKGPVPALSAPGLVRRASIRRG